MTEERLPRVLLSETSRGGDLLQHRPLARALADAIRETPKEESLGIALYGPWGQGKSMIGKLLRECLTEASAGGTYVFVRIDAWKYAHEVDRQPLRRHYLLRAYEAAELEDKATELRRAFSQKIVSESVDERSRVVETFRALTDTAKRNAPQLALVGLALFLVWMLFPDAVGTIVLTIVGLIGVLLVATSVLVQTVVRVLVTGLTVTTEEDPFRSVEEFDHQFTRLLDEDAPGVDRFVFFIDDLDRCDDDTVVEAIETLQAFFGRERCAYVVAADEAQLKRAVRAESTGPARIAYERSVIPIDETFLEKIFQTSAYVPRLFPETLLSYGREITKDTAFPKVAKGIEDDLLGYLIHPNVLSPRQVRVVVNDFLMTYFEALEREGEPETLLTGSRLTADPLLLAKIVVLRAHFPWFFELVQASPELLITWPQTFDVDPHKWSEEQRNADREVLIAARRSVGESRAFVHPETRPVQADDDGASSEEGLPPTEEPSSPLDEQESGAFDEVNLADALIEALRGYLVLTRESQPHDSTHVEELLLLRSRPSFAGLVGDAGRRVRRLIATGDVAPVGEVLGKNPELAGPALRVALDRLRSGTRLERLAARRALLEIVKHVSRTDLDALGEDIVSALYGSSVAELSDDDVEGRQVLVPWLDRRALRAHLRRAWPSHPEEVQTVLDRGLELGATDMVVSSLEANVHEPKLQEAAARALGSGLPETARAYSSAIAGLARHLGDASGSRLAVPFLLESVDGRLVEGQDEERELPLTVVMPEELGWPAESSVNEGFQLDLYEVRGAWHIFRVTSQSDPETVWELPAPPVLLSEERDALARLIRVTLGRASRLDGSICRAFANVSFNSDDEAGLLLSLVKSAVADRRLTGSDVALEAMLSGSAFDSPALAADLIDVSSYFDISAVQGRGRRLIGFAWKHAAAWDAAQASLVEEAMVRMRSALEPVAMELEAEHALDGLSAESAIRAVHRVLAPTAPEAAVDAVKRILEPYAGEAIADDEQALAAALAGFDELESLGGVVPARAGTALVQLDIDPNAPSVCAGYLRVSAASGSNQPLSPGVMKVGSSYSADGAYAGLSCVVRWPQRALIRAVLEGVAECDARLDAKRVADAVRATQAVEREIDQLGRLASFGGIDLAERVASVLGIRNLQRHLLDACRRGKKLYPERIRYSEAWSNVSSKADDASAETYISHLDVVSSQPEFLVVVESLLRYFPARERVRQRPKLRPALLAAAKRVGRITDPDLQQALVQARDQLGIETAKNRRALDRLFAKLFA